MKKTFRIGALLIVITFTSLSSYWFGFSQNERAANRPFSDTLIWNLLPSEPGVLSDYQKLCLLKVVLLNFLISDSIEPVNDEFHNAAVIALKNGTTRDERKDLFYLIMKDVDSIDAEKGLFVSGEIIRLRLPWGTSLVSKNLQGNECESFLILLEENFSSNVFGES
jgi:hypothetical protein